MLLVQALEAVEEQLTQASAALKSTDALALEKFSSSLRQAAVDFSNAMERVQGEMPAELVPRIRQVSAELALQRDQLARVAALVEKQLAVVLPPVDNASTYGSPGRGGSSGARIYRSAG
ncbi:MULTISPECIES: hypothetical protein [unclassified Simplicispira]|jgi:hypothetical protein|uniref:hypothetical protein n=1 Tax=unclassified Simplicispira TaxID=2630407 RepID=UPI000D5CEFAA|nr:MULTISPECIES: hypothetical protein [unclassified Simplicispira]PVY56984.1 hypothetical protein C8D04_2257 [Simplicispira sp. 125]REG17929.1 hypothetical protein C8D01_2567 [Simplicispira sp. 110]